MIPHRKRQDMRFIGGKKSKSKRKKTRRNGSNSDSDSSLSLDVLVYKTRIKKESP